MKNKNRYEIVILGRGGQGAKTTAELIAQAALKKGKFIQAFPQFGPERSGAPVRTYVRISDNLIRTHEPITNPDYLLVLDDGLEAKEIETAQVAIINTKKSKLQLGYSHRPGRNIVPIDASAMAKEIVGESRPNTVILGKFAAVTGAIGIEDLIFVFRNKYLFKIGKEKTEKNIQAILRAYENH